MPGSGTAPHLGCGQPTIGEPLKPARSAGRTSMDGTWTLQGANIRFSAVVARTGRQLLENYGLGVVRIVEVEQGMARDR
jgi:hypothetical protein